MSGGDKTIGDLTEADPLVGPEEMEVEQGGNSRKTTIDDIANSQPMNARFAAIPDPIAMAIIFGS